MGTSPPRPGNLRLLLPVRLPVPVPAGPGPPGSGPPSVCFSEGPRLHAALHDCAGASGTTLVTLRDESTPTARSVLLRAARHAARWGTRLVLVHRGAGGGSLLRTLARECPGMACLAIETTCTPAALATARRFAAARTKGYSEIAVDDLGHATVTGWEETPWPSGSPGLSPGDRVVITGGTGGLGSEVALHLAVRLGVHPVLVDKAPPAAAGTHHALHGLSERRLPFTHVVADVTDAGALSRALPPAVKESAVAVVHCAGLIAAGPVAGLDVARLDRLTAPKVAGLRAVVGALDRRRLMTVLAFGSVLSRIPHPNVGAYAFANEMLRREVGEARHRLPGPRYLVAEWSVWDGAGMAFAMGATAQARRAGYRPIPLTAGLEAVERLLSWRAPVTNVLVGSELPGFRTSMTRSPAR